MMSRSTCDKGVSSYKRESALIAAASQECSRQQNRTDLQQAATYDKAPEKGQADLLRPRDGVKGSGEEAAEAAAAIVAFVLLTLVVTAAERRPSAGLRAVGDTNSI
jgi:hypothetical protein